jgi:hypothetical protein
MFGGHAHTVRARSAYDAYHRNTTSYSSLHYFTLTDTDSLGSLIPKLVDELLLCEEDCADSPSFAVRFLPSYNLSDARIR